jgi:hypothetical protein
MEKNMDNTSEREKMKWLKDVQDARRTVDALGGVGAPEWFDERLDLIDRIFEDIEDRIQNYNGPL